MPSWLVILIQVIEAILGGISKNPPAQTALQAEVDEHAAGVKKLQDCLTILKG